MVLFNSHQMINTECKILTSTLAVIGLLFGWATWKVTLLSMITNFSIFGACVFVFIWIIDNWDKEGI